LIGSMTVVLLSVKDYLTKIQINSKLMNTVNLKIDGKINKNQL